METYRSWTDDRLEGGLVNHSDGLIEVNGVQGYLSKGDIDILYTAARGLPKRARIVEIGSFMGLSALVMARALYFAENYSSRIICVDTWEGSVEHQTLDVVRSRKLYDVYWTNIERSGLATFIVPVRKRSTEAASDVADGSIDMIYVDGDHSFEGCYADLVSWYPKMKPGGLLLGHDCVPDDVHGVFRAVEEFTRERGLHCTLLGQPPVSHYMYSIDRHESCTRED